MILTVLILVTTILVGISYFVSDGFRRYKIFCSEYVAPIDAYFKVHSVYPRNLSVFDKPTDLFDRYESEDCTYSVTGHEYTMTVSNKVSMSIYVPSLEKWVNP